MNNHSSNLAMPSRRDFLYGLGAGLGSVAFSSLLAADEPAPVGKPQLPVKAKRCIFLFMEGGPSHLDTFDPKIELTKRHLQEFSRFGEQESAMSSGKRYFVKSPFDFVKAGECGADICTEWAHLKERVDDICFYRGAQVESVNHPTACYHVNTGNQFGGDPGVGAWVNYGLGTDNQNLPGFVVLPRASYPQGGATNWSNGFLPAQYQGVLFHGGDKPVRDLFPATKLASGADAATRDFISTVNRQHLKRVGDDPALSARIRSYELAAKMQLSIPEVSDVSGETEQTQQAYGITDDKTADMGRRCLLGRRLLERGVRFVQVYSGGPIAGSPRASWDAHESVAKNHEFEAGRIDKPVAALLADLKERGLLKDTLVLFTTEFGRTPFTQAAANSVGPGRDHNRYGFSCWLAGAGVKGGTSVGATDDVGWKAVERPIPWHDFHATLLHLFGIDHERLTHYHNGIQRRLTNVHGEIIEECLA